MSFMEWLTINFIQVINNELLVRAIKTITLLPFRCLIVELYQQEKIIINSLVDNEVWAKKW